MVIKRDFMPKHLFKRWSPDRHKVRNAPGMHHFGKLLDDPNLFHLNRHSVSVAFLIGMFVCFLPIPGQAIVAGAGALIFRCNLPITVGLVWVSNPFTTPFILYMAYRIGCLILHQPLLPFEFELSWDWLQTGLHSIWKPLLLGCLVAGVFFAATSYYLTLGFWRWHVVSAWKRRKRRARRNG
jgi:uncharacterized protein